MWIELLEHWSKSDCLLLCLFVCYSVYRCCRSSNGAIKRINLFTKQFFLDRNVCVCGSFLNASLPKILAYILCFVMHITILYNLAWSMANNFRQKSMYTQGAKSLAMHLNIGIGILSLCLHIHFYCVLLLHPGRFLWHQICSGVQLLTVLYALLRLLGIAFG